ncbi:hypothetical protein AAC691_20475 [Nguyenibacter vanlangensis]|uniref:Uncharacterized protein n=1 Tax=Nguyenibacter vanlangensis TaxID=1216886 RepID=A0ABZ3D4N3_9PROT
MTEGPKAGITAGVTAGITGGFTVGRQGSAAPVDALVNSPAGALAAPMS